MNSDLGIVQVVLQGARSGNAGNEVGKERERTGKRMKEVAVKSVRFECHKVKETGLSQLQFVRLAEDKNEYKE